jgi:hypothetical protein
VAEFLDATQIIIPNLFFFLNYVSRLGFFNLSVTSSENIDKKSNHIQATGQDRTGQDRTGQVLLPVYVCKEHSTHSFPAVCMLRKAWGTLKVIIRILRYSFLVLVSISIAVL